jgi:cyclic-di-AMP phosphodiesterase PgpH
MVYSAFCLHGSQGNFQTGLGPLNLYLVLYYGLADRHAMTTGPKSGKRDRSSSSRRHGFWEDLRCQLSWFDLIVGLGAITAIAALLLGFGYQSIPEYKIGETAKSDIRASQDFTFEDLAATEQRRTLARAGVPALYELDTDRISEREDAIIQLFAAIRDLLAQHKISPQNGLTSTREKELVSELGQRVGEVVPQGVLSVFLHQRSSSILQNKIIQILDGVLREGIVSDRAQFMKDRHSGILFRETPVSSERPLSTSFLARDLPAAREYLSQFRSELANLPSNDADLVLQYLDSLLVPTLIFCESETNARRDLAASQTQVLESQIKLGKLIIREGEQITAQVRAQLLALRDLLKPRSLVGQFCGYFLLAAFFIYALWRYLVLHQSKHRRIRNHALLIFLVLVCGFAVMRLATVLADILGDRFGVNDSFDLYHAIPFAFVALLIALLVDVNVAIAASFLFALLTGLFYSNAGVAAYVMAGCLAGIYSIRQYKARSSLLVAGLAIGAANLATLISLGLLRQTPFVFSSFINRVEFAFISGILAYSLASILLPAFETLFKITTDIRLLELSNLNAPILRQISVEAPGTYHHSLVTGTLAEAAAEAIGANPLLARVGAYYHDIGKIRKPQYFVENQAFGINKHEELSPNMSCMIISSHVRDGLELAKEFRLAPIIRDMIPQHHGTRVMSYFFQKAKGSSNRTAQEIMETDFRYPGPKPQSKEAAIMMMADSVEAASRTLTDPSPAQIQGMINRLVDSIVLDNQFDECDITMREIHLVKESFLKVLTGIFHRRIEYPGYDFQNAGHENEKNLVQSAGSK